MWPGLSMQGSASEACLQAQCFRTYALDMGNLGYAIVYGSGSSSVDLRSLKTWNLKLKFSS